MNTVRQAAGILAATSLAAALAACGSEVAPTEFYGRSVAGGAPGVAVDGSQAELADPGSSTDGSGGNSAVGQDSSADAPAASGGPGAGPGGSTAPTGPAPDAGVKKGSCDGFSNGPGITDDTITLATAADVSGAVPNTFKSAFDAMNAYVAYFNAAVPDGICGRRLALETYDSGLSASGSHNASEAACENAFALVGSMSAFDSGGADVTAECGQPDIRVIAVERARQDSPTSFAVSVLDTDSFFLQPWVWAKQNFGSDIQDAGFVYLNVAASISVSEAIIAATEPLGYEWKEQIVVDLGSVPNWNAYAAQLKDAGIKFVQTNLASYTSRLAAAMKQAGYEPILMADGSAYNSNYLEGDSGAALEGAYLFTQTAMIEEAAKVPEMRLYTDWVARVGGDAPTPTGAQSWAAARLFTTLALQLGGKLNRATMIEAIKGVNTYDGNKIITPGDPGGKTTSKCASILRVDGGGFQRVSPFPYTCGPLA